MPTLSLSARHVLRVDTRYIVSRRWQFENCASVLAFPPDPSEFRSDQVWVEDVAAKQRRQPGVAGADGLYPVVHYRTKGQLQWDIGLRVWRILNGNLEIADTDKVLNPRERNLETALYKSRIEREILAWHVLNDASTLTQGVTLGAGSRFDDISSTASDPLAVLKVGAMQIKRQTGMKVNLIMIPDPIMMKLGLHERLMSYAVNKLNLSKDRPIDAEVLEQMIGYDLIEKGSIKAYDATFNNTNDGPYATESSSLVYFSGPTVVMMALATPGGNGGMDYGFGLGKYLSILESALPNDDTVQIATGNNGYGVYNFPNYDLAGGGDTVQVVDAWAPFMQNAKAAYRISTAATAANTDYDGSLDFTP